MTESKAPSQELINLSQRFNRMFKKRFPYGYFRLAHRRSYFNGWEIPWNGGEKVSYDRSLIELVELEACLDTTEDIQEKLEKAIERLKKTKPTHLKLNKGKTYKVLEEREIGGVVFEEGAKFKCVEARKPWKGVYELILISGKIKAGHQRIFYGKKSLQPNPVDYGLDFITADEFTQKTGIAFKDTRIFYTPWTPGGWNRYERVETARDPKARRNTKKTTPTAI